LLTNESEVALDLACPIPAHWTCNLGTLLNAWSRFIAPDKLVVSMDRFKRLTFQSAPLMLNRETYRGPSPITPL